MKEIIITMTSDNIKVKGGEYVQDLVRCEKCGHKDDDCDYCHELERFIKPDDFCSLFEVGNEQMD